MERAADTNSFKSAAIREELDRRFDELSIGQVKPVPGAEAIARIQAKLDAQHK